MTNLLRFLGAAEKADWGTIAAMSAISGFAGGAILAIVNMGASAQGAEAPPTTPKHQLVLLFAVTIAIYALTKRYSALRTSEIPERLVTDLRLRVCDKLRRSELETVEGLDKGEAFAAITQDA